MYSKTDHTKRLDEVAALASELMAAVSVSVPAAILTKYWFGIIIQKAAMQDEEELVRMCVLALTKSPDLYARHFIVDDIGVLVKLCKRNLLNHGYHGENTKVFENLAMSLKIGWIRASRES